MAWTLRSVVWRERSSRSYVAILLSLSLGIAGVTGVYSVIRATPLLSRWTHSSSLVWFMVEDRGLNVRTLPRGESFRAWKEGLRSLDRIAAFALTDGTVRGDHGGRRVQTAWVGEELFDLVGKAPTMGRAFDRSDRTRHEDIAVIREGLARSVFGGRRRALGNHVTVDGRSLLIVGLVPEGFGEGLLPGNGIDVLRPLTLEPDEKVWVLGRLARGVTIRQAQAELDAWGRGRTGAGPDGEDLRWVLLEPSEMLSTATRRMLEIFLISALLLVLVTGSNVAHLLAAQVEAERREVAARWALGAGRLSLLRWKSIRLLFLTVAAGLAGAALANGSLELITAILPQNLQFFEVASVGLAEVGFAVTLSFGTLLVVTLPGLFRSSEGLMEALRGDPRFGKRPSSYGRLLGDLHVVTMVAVSLALAVASIQVFRTAHELRKVDIGFEVDGVQVAEVSLPESSYRLSETRRAFFSTLLQRLSAMGRVQGIALASPGPLDSGLYLGQIRFGGQGASGSASTGVGAASVSPGYFRTLRQRLIAGREFIQEDLRPESSGIVVSETTAKRFGPDPALAVGRYIRFGDEQREVLGVVADVQTPGSAQPFGTSKVYWPLARYDTSVTVLLRGPSEILPLVRQIAGDLDPDAIVETAPMELELTRSMGSTRFLAALLLVLTSLAFALALLGVYGVLSKLVAREKAQIALRLALGARRGEVRAWVFRRGLLRCAAGITIGVLASYPLCRLLADEFQGVAANDPWAKVWASALVLAATIVATWLPTLSTSRIAPHEVLKSY